MRRNNLNIFSYLALIFFAIVGFVYLFWSFYPYKTIEFTDKVFPISNKIVKRGEAIRYTANYCKCIDKEALVTREFRNELIFVAPSTINNRPSGCHSLVIQTIIPEELPTGKFTMRMTYQYQVNPIRTITIIQDTEEFEVVE
jgi:hypothetical protein